jgi:hypothetical protein
MLPQSFLQKTHQKRNHAELRGWRIRKDLLFDIPCYVLNQTPRIPSTTQNQAGPAMIYVQYLQQVGRLAAIDRPRSATVKFDETALVCRDFRLARGGIGCLYEQCKMEIGVQVIWDDSLAAGCGGSMDICEGVCRFEELGTLQR